MSGSIYGKNFTISTWGESHGKAIGVVIDGCPAGISLTESDIQIYLDRRKPGNSKYATKRIENDRVEIMSGVFNNITTGTPISMIVYNLDQRSNDYSEISKSFRPGHADYGYEEKYGIRDYRGGGRSSGRETVARVAAGAVAKKVLKELGIDVYAYTLSIGEIEIDRAKFDFEEMRSNTLAMPDHEAFLKASKYLDECIENEDSAGGIVECIATGLKVGIGEPVFEKLDATIAQGIFSIGAVKGLEFGSGFSSAKSNGSINNDQYYYENNILHKKTNNAGGILGGISDGSDIILRAAFKPTSSIHKTQQTVNKANENITINIEGRHDPIIVARAVVVVECMTAISILDSLLQSLTSNMDTIKKAYKK